MKETSFLAGWFDEADSLVIKNNDNKMPDDFVGAVEWLGAKVESFLQENKLVSASGTDENQVLVANEHLTPETIGMQCSAGNVYDLCQSCGVPQAYLGSAVKRIGILMNHCFSSSKAPAQIWANYTRKTNLNNAASLEELYPSNIMSELRDGKAGTTLEAFGIHMDVTQPDIKMGIVVTLMQYFTALTPRIVPIVPTTQPSAQVKREESSVVDMSIANDKPTRQIELYKNPEKITSVLKRIIPLVDNQEAGEDFLVSDGVLKFNVKADLRDLSLVTGKDGYDRFNHSDILADNVLLEKVMLTLNTDAGTAETFELAIPPSRARYGRKADTRTSADRYLTLDGYQIILTNNTKQADGTASTLLASLTANDGVMVDLTVNSNINLESGVISATGFATLKPFSRIAGIAPTDELKAFVATLTTCELAGYVPDARYSEENLRKTNIRSKLDITSKQYELPTGRALVVDWAFGQEAAPNAAARLAQIEHIGKDARNLDIIEGVAMSVKDEIKMQKENPEAFEDAVGLQFAAGSIVNPYVFAGELDFTKVTSIRSSDASGDIKQFVKQYLNALTTEMLNESLYRQQLAQGAAPVFRMITSEVIRGMALCCKHIHPHLDKQVASTGGAEYVMELDNGVIIEVVTTTFSKYDHKMLLIPWLGNTQTVLSYGLDFDLGTMIGNYTVSHDGVYQRMFSTSRDLLVPTNVLLASVDVKGLEAINNLAL